VKTEKIKLYDSPVHIENAHFMEVPPCVHLNVCATALTTPLSVQPVIKLWLHDVSSSMPVCAAAVF
jgi:hypothetical protein